MPDNVTEGVAEHSSRLQPSINLHAPVPIYSLYVQLLWYRTNVLAQRDEEENVEELCRERYEGYEHKGEPCAVAQASYNVGTHSGPPGPQSEK